jgi:CheY-like chemotaxis protein
VLLVDEVADTLRITARLLQSMGLRVTTARDDLEAVDIALLCMKVGYGIDLILLNVQPWRAGGIETVGELRSGGFTGPVIAISDESNDDLEAQCLEAGCDDFIPHPLDFEPIYDSLVRHLPRQSKS